MALADLDEVGDDAAATTAVLARFAAMQVVLQAEAGLISGGTLATARLIALTYLSDLSAFRPGERQALDSVLQLTSRAPVPALAEAIVQVGGAAEAWGHYAGADAYYQTAYRIGLARGWTAQAARAARAIADLAAAGRGRASVSLWRRRATTLERTL